MKRLTYVQKVKGKGKKRSNRVKKSVLDIKKPIPHSHPLDYHTSNKKLDKKQASDKSIPWMDSRLKRRNG